MQDGSEETDFRDKASRCRLKADTTSDERSAASLRNLAEEYDMAADAVEQRNGFHRRRRPDAVGEG